MTDKIDELSKALDELNTGRKPKQDDAETSELLEMAALIKKVDFQVRPPQHLLDQTVSRAAAGLTAAKFRRRNAWMYSGMLGTAAAVILVIGLQVMPFLQQISPSELPPEPPPSSAAPIENIVLPMPIPPVVAPPPPVVIAPPVARKAPASASADTPASVPVAVAPAAASRAAGNVPAPVLLSPLRLPDRIPGSIVTDKTTGTLRQIYDGGTPQQLVIIQRIPAPTDAATQPQPKIAARMEMKKEKADTPTAVNSVTVTVQGQEVTLEGRLTKQELLDLAKTLIP